ncbi:MAG: hypothetical protein MJA27_16720 [Pseudanabaenales cyanobacterium]|nr:hypothetical protein [Pseudanabaenales cyanobacterium]
MPLDLSQWRVALASPGLKVEDSSADLSAFELRDSQLYEVLVIDAWGIAYPTF